jgi:NAD(P)-dependent dehydrogenase (short-subunit alcohol dehydrogenase family)
MTVDMRFSELLSLKGKVAVITGAASGIGLATARALAHVGARVALLDIDERKGKEAEEEIRKVNGEANFIRCDVRSDAECRRAIECVCRKFGGIDILINNAGVIRRKSIADTNEEEWDLVVDVNLKGIYLVSRHVIPHLIRSGGGTIVNIGSGWGLHGGPNAAAYCASKGGVVNLTRAMAIDCGKDNIRVNCVCPGDTETPMLKGEATQLGEDEKKFLSEAARRPLSRIGQPEDIANAVLYLVSSLSAWVTGSVIVVDGGGTA